MGRQIRFRGKSLQTGEWFYGYLQQYQGQYLKRLCVCAVSVRTREDSLLYEVIPDTVGQFTGLYDRTGKEIYEGDIITWLQHRMDRTGYIEQGHVEWRDVEGCYIVVNRVDTRDGRELIHKLIGCTEHTTVIGNRFDNPELLKGGGE